jgi:S-adenosylmethionine:tRNA ribosyltransferase-isomerase
MNPKDISIDSYDYPLPEERIAAHPLAERDHCRLLVSRQGQISDHFFNEIVDLLPSNALLIYNNTRVINARLRFHKDSGALIEIFCLEPVAPADYVTSFAADGASGVEWKCFVGNSKRWKLGTLTMTLADGTQLHAERTAKVDDASTVRFTWTGSQSWAEVIAAVGELPIPPYLNRSTEEADKTDYQTVFSRIDGSVAAPTAGLHFTPQLLAQLDERGICRRELTLHVGAGTFKPVKADHIGQHEMHGEFIEVDRRLIEQLLHAERPVIAVGTTSVRTLESLYHLGCRAATGESIDELPQWYPYSPTHPNLTLSQALESLLGAIGNTLMASTRVIIAPGYQYRVVDGIITNFHQPRSTLLLLVSAFIGDGWRELYDHALANPGYRFLSYGDACLLMK